MRSGVIASSPNAASNSSGYVACCAIAAARIGRQARRERERASARQISRDVGPRAAGFRHLGLVEQRGDRLILERAAAHDHDLARQRVFDFRSCTSIPEELVGPDPGEVRRREARRDLRRRAEQRVRPRVAVAVERGDARRAHDVVDRAFVDGGVPPRARIAAAGARPVAGAASHGAVARELLVPEQDLAEHALRLRDRVLRGHGHGRQVCRERRARGEREQEHQCGAFAHRRILPATDRPRSCLSRLPFSDIGDIRHQA